MTQISRTTVSSASLAGPEWPAIPESCDVLVAGAGIAGASAARLLAEQGLSVVLAERETFPRYKVCGSCLNLRSLAHLRKFGLLGALESKGAVPLFQAVLGNGARTATVPLPGGLSVSRGLLDALLADAAVDRGAIFLQQTTVAIGPVAGARRVVTLKQGGTEIEIAARVVIAADGLNGSLMGQAGAKKSVVAKNSRIGLGAIYPGAPSRFEPGRIYMACGRSGYVGLVRAENNQLVIAAAMDPEFVREQGGPAGAVKAVLHSTPMPPLPELRELSWKGTPPLTRQAPRHSAARVLVLGDAGGYVEPFTGEGMAWAFASARDLAVMMDSGLAGDWSILADAWDRSRRRSMRRKRLLCHGAARVLRSPWATGAAIAALSASSSLSRPFVRLLNSEKRS